MRYSNTESRTVTERIVYRPEKMQHQQPQQSIPTTDTPLVEQRPLTNGEAQQVQAAQQEPTPRQVFHCVNCEIEFFWPPTIVQDKIYCCTGCAAGGPCNCDYSLYRSVTILGVI